MPAKIGALRQLRKLKCNGNSLEHLPDEIGQCRQLEEIICSENKLVALPRALGTCKKLRISSRRTTRWPCARRRSRTCRLVGAHQPRGQPPIGHDPKKIRGDTELILWVLRLHRDNEVESQYVLSCIDTLEGISRGATERHRELRLELKKVDEDRANHCATYPTASTRSPSSTSTWGLKKAKTKRGRNISLRHNFLS